MTEKNMLMTLFFFHLLIFSSFVKCMRCGLDVCSLIGATATFTNEAFFCNGRDCHPTRVIHKKKKLPIFDHRQCFSVWSRLKSCDPISLKPHANFSHEPSFLRTPLWPTSTVWGSSLARALLVLIAALCFLVVSSTLLSSLKDLPFSLCFPLTHVLVVTRLLATGLVQAEIAQL